MVLLAGCQEEIWPNGRVEEGVPTSLDFTVSVPAAEEVTVTRASVADYESEIRELMLIMFEESGRKMVIDVTPYMDNGAAGTIENGHRIYTLTRPIDQDMYGGDVLTGNYKVYAIANWSSPFCGLKDLDKLSEEDLVAQIAQNTGFVYGISGNARFPMSCVADNVTLAPEGSSLKINLKRLVSRIEFTFKNGQSTTTKDGKEVDENPNFTPTSYTIYNIPAKANLFSKDDNRIANGSFSKSSAIALTSREFEFFMLENIQNAKQDGCVRQDMREYWTGGEKESATAPEDKDFLYAPEDGTFVVVSGTYNGTSYIGEVSYTIHLGNFSEGVNTANGKDFSNFKVNRNERQKYTVTVNGVKSIYTEVTDSEVNPGVEGSITETAVNTFVLDAHYEKVMMNVSEIGNPSYLFVNTPYCKDNNGHALVNLASVTEAQLKDWGLDYEWVHFMKPDSQDEFPTFKMADSGNIWQLIQDILDGGDAQYYANIGGVLYTAAFVDEYFYEGKDWQTFVNTNNRTMSIRPGVEYSDDGNSSLVQNSHIEISQRSIKTTYAFDGKDPNDGVYVPFGIETWDETGKVYFYGSSQNSDTGNNYNVSGLTDDNGWNNTVLFTSGQLPANPSKAGYLTAVSDNSKESHVYSAYTALAEGSRAKGYNACLLRNRDENQDGKITDAELKWYLPAIDQYTSIWLSEDLLHEDTQLFDRANLSSASNSLNMESVYYSSSSYEKRLYWALEGASYGRSYGSSYDNPRNSVRCVRNLVSKDNDRMYDDIPSSLTTANGMIISAQNITAVRTVDHVGEYGIGHKERSEDNKLPAAFEVAKVYLGETIGAGTGNLITIPAKTWLVLNTSGCNATRTGNNWSGYTYILTLSISPIEGDSYTCNGVALNAGNKYTAEFNNGSSTTLSVLVTKADGSKKTIPVTFEYSGWSGYNGVEYDGEDPEQEVYDGEIRTGNRTGNKDKFTVGSFNATDLCATGYYQMPDKSDLGMWRVPNQREFMLMLQYDYLISTGSEGCISSTFLTGTFKTQPFSTYNAGITLDNRASNLYVRCVMDAQVFGGEDTGDNGNTGGGTTPPDQGSDEGGEA